MFRTVRSSNTTAWLSRTSRVVSLCRKSLRRSVIRAWTRATLSRALSRFAEPFWLRAIRRCASASRARSRRSCRGLAIFSPVDRVSQGRDPRVDADNAIAGRMGLDRALAQHRHEPASGRVPADRHRGRFRAVRQGTRPHDGQLPGHLREMQLAVAVPEPRPGVLRACPGFLPRLEPRVLRAGCPGTGRTRTADAAAPAGAGPRTPRPGTRGPRCASTGSAAQRTEGRSRVPAAGSTPPCALRARGCRPCGRIRRSGTVPRPARGSGRSGICRHASPSSSYRIY